MTETITTFHSKHFLQKSDPNPYEDANCILCQKEISFESISSYCRKCDFHFHHECATTLMESNLTINHPRTHEHTLTFVRKRNCFSCDVCGKVEENKMNMYGCLLCDFFVHRNCIYLPRVIKISRHPHRLFHTLQLSGEYMKCGVCNKKVRGSGRYICTDKTCVYKVHSYCATNSIVWDGKDLEGTPEDISIAKDVVSSSLKEEDGKIRHFSHDHVLMKLYTDDEDEDERVCEACIRPIVTGSFLSCKECDFALHEACANLPRQMDHILHCHALILQADIKEGYFTCSICDQESCGFMYRCCREECGFKIDAKCASFAEPFYHGAHDHPLTLFQSLDGYSKSCYGCFRYKMTMAACYECSFWLDFKCAFKRQVIKYKYDTHPLTLCFSFFFSPSMSTFSMWCDICEVKIDLGRLRKNPNFYICYDCEIVVHTECLIGRYPYLKPGHTIKVSGFVIRISSNNRFSRPVCHICHSICQDKLVFVSTRDNLCFCSIKCIHS